MATSPPCEFMNSEAVRMLLTRTRSKIEEESPNDALSALLQAIRLTQGEGAILGILDAAKRQVEEEYSTQEDALTAAKRMLVTLVNDTSTLLYERGDEHILRDAFQDGSSVVCKGCKSLVSRERFRQHQLYWCILTSENQDIFSDDNT
jgi:hypothetical protein